MAKANVGGGLSGAASGASTGAAVGSIVPGVGTAVGGAVGGIIGGIAGLFGKKKKKKKPKRLSSLDPAQEKLNKQQYEALEGKGPLGDLYNYNPQMANEVFEKTIGNPAYRKFKENIIPEITGQFRNKNLQHSSYAGDALSKAGRDVQESLDAQRANYLYGKEQSAQQAKQQAVENLQNRNTFDYERGGAPKTSSMDTILKSVPELVDTYKKYFPEKTA